MDVQLFQTILSLLLCQLTVFMRIYFWALCFISLVGLFFHQCHSVLITIALYWVLKVYRVSPPALIVFNVVLTTLGLWPLYINFRISLSIPVKITCWPFDCALGESIDQVGKNWNLDSVGFFWPWTQNVCI